MCIRLLFRIQKACKTFEKVITKLFANSYIICKNNNYQQFEKKDSSTFLFSLMLL